MLEFGMVYFKSLDEKNLEQKENVKKGVQDLETLNSCGNEVSIEILQKCLSHPYQFIRIIAIESVSDYCRKDFIPIFAIALNDRCEYVVEESAKALAKINTDEALEILSAAFFEDEIERPQHLAMAISQFGERGFAVLVQGTKTSSSNIRYYSAKLLGSIGLKSAREILEELINTDNEKTSFNSTVSSGARKGFKSLSKIRLKENNE